MFYDERNRCVIRIGDTTTHGGKVLTGEDRMPVMGRPVARIGDMVWCPQCDNKEYPIIEGSKTIQIFGRGVSFEGDRTACGATLISSLRTGGQVQSTSVASNVTAGSSGATTNGNGGTAAAASLSNQNNTETNNTDDFLKLDERAILMRYKEAIAYMNKYG